MLWCPPPMGVVVGPLRPTRVISSEAKTSSGINWPCSVSARRPASTLCHSIAAPVASTARTEASATSGPVPSPGMSVIKWAIYSYYKVGVGLVPDWFSERRHMVDTQLRRRGICDERVLAAMLEIPREEFVPVESRLVAYQDAPIPIGEGQTISQPYMTALMAESLELRGTERVLEVGAGCGYAAAVLGALAARVTTLEILPRLVQQARDNLRRTVRDGNVQVVAGDGSGGYSEGAAYYAISRAAGAPEVPAALVEQLNDPGLLVIPVGALDDQELRVLTMRAGPLDCRVPTLCRFVPLRGGEGWQ